jgi:UDP-glucose 4-epimerase
MKEIGTSNPISMQEQIEGIIEVFSPKDKKSEIIYLPDEPSGKEYSLDIENTREELGYEPQYGYLDYLKDFKKEMELDRFREIL